MLALSVHEKSQCSGKIMCYIDCLVQSEMILNCRRMKRERIMLVLVARKTLMTFDLAYMGWMS